VDPVAWNSTPEPSWSTLREPEPKLRATVAEAESDMRKTTSESMTLLASGGGESSLSEE
jgi:hypothetical protein